jgi:Flp pilus assembly pilin Flp
MARGCRCRGPWCTILGVDRAGGQRGATGVAYALMVAIVALLLVGGVFVLGGSIEGALTDAGGCVANIGDCGGSGGGGGGNGGGGGGGGGTTTTTGAGATTTTAAP